MVKRKQKNAFYAGILFMAVGFWMIFVVQDNLGFIPSILGALLLYWRW